MSARTVLTTAAASILAAGALTTMTTSAADASATGVEPFPGGYTVTTKYGDVTVPPGELDHGVTGEGLFVESQAAGFTTVPALCNWTMTYELRDLEGNVKSSVTRDPGSRCDTNVNAPGVVWNKTTVPGRACAILKVGSAVIAQQCHQVAG
ncbi:hypothetical protein [Nocardioides flavescens]|uniref:Secreted protein n=1 Tax=Nocardioides flavescens TaxID=2691959 RepID=A0A6L7EZC3_9ACTN|nr:hypothetical protein [Nocardioides flavescens]MXG91606.1 hypothetical protein [Nocardioides flavescens]